MFKIAHYSCLFSSLFFVLFLKLLHMFHFIKWHPTKFLHAIEDPFARYVVLFILIYFLTFILFLLSTTMKFPAVGAFLVAVVVVLMVECVLMQKEILLKNISISFFVLSIIACRFIMETASFHSLLRRR